MNRATENRNRVSGWGELSQSYSKIDPMHEYDLTCLKGRVNDPKLVDQFQSAIRAVRRKLANS